MTRHSSKNRYMDARSAMKAAHRYTEQYGFLHRFYECDECDYWHLSTVTHQGVQVLSLDALKQRRTDT